MSIPSDMAIIQLVRYAVHCLSNPLTAEAENSWQGEVPLQKKKNVKNLSLTSSGK